MGQVVAMEMVPEAAMATEMEEMVSLAGFDKFTVVEGESNFCVPC